MRRCRFIKWTQPCSVKWGRPALCTTVSTLLLCDPRRWSVMRRSIPHLSCFVHEVNLKLTVRPTTVRVLIKGAKMTGKTSLFRRLQAKPFNPECARSRLSQQWALNAGLQAHHDARAAGSTHPLEVQGRHDTHSQSGSLGRCGQGVFPAHITPTTITVTAHTRRTPGCRRSSPTAMHTEHLTVRSVVGGGEQRGRQGRAGCVLPAGAHPPTHTPCTPHRAQLRR